MNIGVDMDNTICSTNEKIDEYKKIYSQINNIDDDFLSYNNEHKLYFLKNYLPIIYANAELKENAAEILKELRQELNKILIVTSRSTLFIPRPYESVYSYLESKKITVDKILINCQNKAEICKNYNIKLMIDDSRSVHDDVVSGGIDSIIFDEHQRNLDIANRAQNWNQVKQLVKTRK